MPVPEYHAAHKRYYLPYVTPVETIVSSKESERVPPGQLAVHRGTRVEATDGHVGQVAELLLDEDDGHITHLILQKGHLWARKRSHFPCLPSTPSSTIQST
jgi:hypothetical protein